MLDLSFFTSGSLLPGWGNTRMLVSFSTPLDGQGPLLDQFVPPASPSSQDLAVPVFGLGPPSLRPDNLLPDFLFSSPDFQVSPSDHFGQGNLHVFGDPVHLGNAFLLHFIQERVEDILMQPLGRFWQRHHWRQFPRAVCRHQVSQNFRLPYYRLGTFREFHGEQPLMNHLSQPVGHLCSVEVHPGWSFVS